MLLNRYSAVALDRPISGHILEAREWVVCGSFFKPVPGLDPVSLGAFWKARQKEFPRREFKAPIAPASLEGIELNLGPDIGPLRTWLISKDDVFIIQVQHDRFYLNWRVRQDAYPRFNDWDANKGLLSRFLCEHEAFERFCSEELGARLELQGIELAKIDRLQRKHPPTGGSATMAQPAQYQPAVIAEFASKLYAEASRLVIKWTLMLGVVGAVIGAAVTFAKGGGGMVPLIAGIVGALFGASYGREKGFALRLQAQMALCQLQIEQNTRPKI